MGSIPRTFALSWLLLGKLTLRKLNLRLYIAIFSYIIYRFSDWCLISFWCECDCKLFNPQVKHFVCCIDGSFFFRNIQEEVAHEVFRLNNLYYPLEVTTEETPPLAGFPWIKPTMFLRTMARMNDLSHLLGGKTLKEAAGTLEDFWKKYRALHPQHQLWRDIDSGKKKTSKCIPVYLHGDEGVTYKRGGVLVLSFQGVLGHGSRKSQKVAEVRGELRAWADHGIRLNFLKTGLQTRILICVCPKDHWALQLCCAWIWNSWSTTYTKFMIGILWTFEVLITPALVTSMGYNTPSNGI